MKAWASLWERDNVAGRGRLYCPVGPVLWPYGQALSNYVDHFHTERNHQGKGNILLFPRNTDRHRGGRFAAASDWVGSCATIIVRRRDGASVGQIIWPYAYGYR